MAKRSTRTAAAIAVLLLVAAACGSGATPAPDTPAPSPGDRPLFVAVAADAARDATGDLAAFEASIGALGGAARVDDAARDPRLTIRLVEAALADGAAGISVTGPDGSIGPAVARLAAAADVPLVATGARLAAGGGRPVPFVGRDDRELGRQAGDGAAALLREARWEPADVGVLAAEIPTLPACSARIAGMREALAGAGVRASAIVTVPYSGGVDSAADAALPLVVGGPATERWIVVGCTDAGVEGAARALGTAKVEPANVIGVGLGGDLACRAWAAGGEGAFAAAVFVYGGEVGAAAARILWDAARSGEPPPAATIVPGALVTADRFEELVPPSVAEACAASAAP